MASYNRVIIMGNLTRDPEYKQLTSGQAVCRLGLASNRQFKNKQTGMMVQEVCFVDIDVWGPQAESCNQYLQKGRAVLVEGRLKLDSWVDNDGQRRSKHSIIADRVTFLAAAQVEAGNVEFDGDTPDFTTQKAATKVVDKEEEAETVEVASADTPTEQKLGGKKKRVKAQETSAGEVNLDAEEPFEDDLPF